MLNVKCNYRGKYSDVLCPCCKLEEDTQQHLLVCSSLSMDGVVAGSLPDYNDLFCENLSKQVQISSILKACYEERKNQIEGMKMRELQKDCKSRGLSTCAKKSVSRRIALVSMRPRSH